MIVGPGTPYVAEAKRMLAGPTETLVIADESGPLHRGMGRRDRCRCHQVFERLSWLLTRGVQCCDIAGL